MSLLCLAGFHKLKVVKAFTFESRCCYCSRCKSYFAMNDSVKAFVPWDGQFSKIHEWSPYEYDEALTARKEEA